MKLVSVDYELVTHCFNFPKSLQRSSINENYRKQHVIQAKNRYGDSKFETKGKEYLQKIKEFMDEDFEMNFHWIKTFDSG